MASLNSTRSFITALDHATDLINERSRLGSTQNKLRFTMSNLSNQTQNIEVTRASIQNTAFAAILQNILGFLAWVDRFPLKRRLKLHLKLRLRDLFSSNRSLSFLFRLKVDHITSWI